MSLKQIEDFNERETNTLMDSINPDFITTLSVFSLYLLRKYNCIYSKQSLNYIINEKLYNELKKSSDKKIFFKEKILVEIKKMGFDAIIHADNTRDNNIPKGTYVFMHEKYPIYITMGYYYDFIDKDENAKGKLDLNLNIDDIDLLYYPNNTDQEYTNKTIDIIIDIINCITDNIYFIEKQNNITEINIITKSQDGYNLTQKEIERDIVFEELDLHYGKGFTDKYNKLIKNINSNSKGIILFHGLPGTGKTHCIKHLITQLNNKIPIYITSDIVENFINPDFIDFLLYEAEILDNIGENLFFVIEDAEKLIMKRDDTPYSSSGISNLLNTTDGILNGMLNIQAILTFNTDIKNVDSAILRNERLLGEFEFGFVEKERINKLAEYLKINNMPKDFYKNKNVIADIYALKKERNTIKFSANDNNSENEKFIL